ncbi:HNH endonuclease [Microcystis aeruginosa]|jgi:5-methylcytosine-specific restriction endonuclease McrA|nr:HNH endonuclease [Microcystis aeruginosa]MDB9397660.1 HNH endonuclease [Microcystis aeruginosa CS-573]
MIDKTIHKFIRERAEYLCGYCHSPEEAGAALFEIDHIIPQSLGGSELL